MGEEFLIKCRGIPFSTTTQDVINFLSDVNILNGEKGVHLPKDCDGRASGCAFVELASAEDVSKAEAHHKEHMGSRYVEVSVVERSEMDWFVNRQPGMGGNNNEMNDGFVRLRGLPFEATKSDIATFFKGFTITPYGITITMDQDGRPSGEAYVEFTSPDQVEKALAKNKEKIGHRYIEIFNSSRHDVRYVTQSSFNKGPGGYGGGGGGGPQRGGMGGGRSGPYDRPSGFNSGGRGGFRGGRGGGGRMGDSMTPRVTNSTTGFMVHMRGLPFEATQGDIFKFFAPLVPAEVRILNEDSGRPKGEADVDFNSYQDAEKSMEKNKQNMGHRYIELFLRCSNNGGGGGWGNANSTPLMGNGGYGGYGGGGNYGNNGYNGGGGFGGGYGGGNNGGYSWQTNNQQIPPAAAGGYGGGNYYSNNTYN